VAGRGKVRGAPLEPIRVVERELTRPDGTTVKVQVPVYPPFRLASQEPATAGAGAKPPGRRRPPGKAKPRRGAG
jgi:hypothetical protein